MDECSLGNPTSKIRRAFLPPPARIHGGQNTKEKCPFLFRRNWSRANPKSKEHFSLVSPSGARWWRGILMRGVSAQNGFYLFQTPTTIQDLPKKPPRDEAPRQLLRQI